MEEKPKTVEQVCPNLQDIAEPYVVEDDAKNRCQHSRRINQCKFNSIPNTEYCKYHIALHVAAFRKQNTLKKYHLTQHYSRIKELTVSGEEKSLREEVGILNYLLETLLNQCHTPWDFQVNGSRIESLVEKISKTMMLGHKLEMQTGQVLDKNTLAVFVDEVIRIISDEINEPETLKRIGERIGASIEKAQSTSATNAVFKDKTTGL